MEKALAREAGVGVSGRGDYRDTDKIEEILESIEKKAAAYVPEWRLDGEKPDMGLALAQVFAAMHSKTERNYQKLPEKFGRDFFNCLNTSMKASAPAKGYVVFGMAEEELPGTPLPAGTSLQSDVTDDLGERIPVETMEDLYVVPDTLAAIYQCSDDSDYIGACFEGQEQLQSFSLFGGDKKNQQEHVFCVGHPCVLSIQKYGRIRLTFYEKQGRLVSGEFLERLADPKIAGFFYSSKDGQIPLTQVKTGEGWLEVEKTGALPLWEKQEYAGVSSFWLECRIYCLKAMEHFSFEKLFLSANCPFMAPDLVYGGGGERPEDFYFPFGEQPSVYGEVYFVSDEVLSKKGAVVELSFMREFAKVPIDAGREEEPIRWRLVMNKEEVRQEREYVISIEEVVWEYYNGFGWTSLSLDSHGRTCFQDTGDGYCQHFLLCFKCPQDIQPVLVNAREGYAIRSRIRKMNHAFKMNGCYLSPVLSDIMLRYEYPEEGLCPGWIYCKNNLEEQVELAEECMGALKPFFPVKGTGNPAETLYLGFRKMPDQGPVRMLFVTDHDFDVRLPSLLWEYYGTGFWKPLNPADETGNFARTGEVAFSGLPEAEKLSLFGKELYWIRIQDKEGVYKTRGAARPCLNAIYMNAVRVHTVKSGLKEYFTMERYESGVSFSLLNRNIHSLQVWVLENRIHGKEELKAFREEGRLEEIRDEDGTLLETWVQWQETDQFLHHSPRDRCYQSDANEGKIYFGGGLHGAIPAPGVPGGIQVRYSIGGGKNCNLPAEAVNGLELSAGFITMVKNPLPLSGGYDRETAKEAEARAGRALCHRFQAVTGEDYLALAMEAGKSMEKSACFSGIDQEGRKKPGTITMVFLKKDYHSGGRFFEELRREIQETLEPCLPVGMVFGQNLFIREPVLVRIELALTVQVKSFSLMFSVRGEIEKTLKRFLDPVLGNFDGRGWEIGSLPDQMQLETLIKGVKGVLLLKSCVVFACLDNEAGKPEVDLKRMEHNPFVLPVSGKHQVFLEVC